MGAYEIVRGRERVYHSWLLAFEGLEFEKGTIAV